MLTAQTLPELRLEPGNVCLLESRRALALIRRGRASPLAASELHRYCWVLESQLRRELGSQGNELGHANLYGWIVQAGVVDGGGDARHLTPEQCVEGIVAAARRRDGVEFVRLPRRAAWAEYEAHPGSLVAVPPKPEPAPAARAPRPYRPAPSPPKVVPVDASAQANALIQAAQSGTPFCEECERKREQSA